MAGRVGVLGLGLMGEAFAQHFISDGYEVLGYDPEAKCRDAVAEAGGEVFDTIAEVVNGVELVILSLPNSDIMLEVSSDIVASGADGLLVIDTTTGNPDHSLTAAEQLAGAGHSYVDATISGNAAQFRERDVIYMVGGEPDDVERTIALLTPLGRGVYPVGGISSGSRAKLVVNHILSINRTAVAEGLAVAEKAGIDLDSMLTILRDSAAYSKAMDLWGDRMVSGEYHPPASRIRQSHKDSRLINDHAESIGASHDVVDMVRQHFVEAEEGGLSDSDNAAMIEVMRRRAGIGRIDPPMA